MQKTEVQTTVQQKSEIKCHICGAPFDIVPQDGGGVILRCDNPVGCVEFESVFGFGRNAKDAAAIAAQKYKK
jgi:hypothetical protein